MLDEDFIKKYEDYEKQTVEELIKKSNFSKTELAHTISHLIHHRESMKDYELEKLQYESEKFIEKIKESKRKQLLEEIKCFKDIIALEKQLLKLKKDGP